MRFWWILLVGFGCGKGTSSDTTTTTGVPTGTGTATATGTGTGSGTGTGTATGTGTGTGTNAFSIEIGNGEQSHAPIGVGTPVTMVHGPQNGWHVEVSGEVRGLGQVVGVAVWIDRTDTGARVADNGNPTFLQLAGFDAVDNIGWFAGESAFIDTDQAGVCALSEVAATVCAEAEDLAAPGTLASGCQDIVLTLDPLDVAICAGTGTGTTGTGTSTTGTGTGTTGTGTGTTP